MDLHVSVPPFFDDKCQCVVIGLVDMKRLTSRSERVGKMGKQAILELMVGGVVCCDVDIAGVG